MDYRALFIIVIRLCDSNEVLSFNAVKHSKALKKETCYTQFAMFLV